ncbi:hypothetical protein MMC25_002294 [Agyrium rufum]|nr:hypothetical protein [Agyrium rufum]
MATSYERRFSPEAYRVSEDLEAMELNLAQDTMNGHQAPSSPVELSHTMNEPEELVELHHHLSGLEDEGPLESSRPNTRGGSTIGDFYGDSVASITETEYPRIQAFAKLEFDDGEFFMNTHSIELGRDVRTARVAHQFDLDEQNPAGPGLRRKSTSSGEGLNGGRNSLQERSHKIAGSVVSDSGGIIGVHMEEFKTRVELSKKRSKSVSTGSQSISRHPSFTQPQDEVRQGSPFESNQMPHRNNTFYLRPSPQECPLIPIHPPSVAEGAATGHRGISRKHVKIAFNFEKRIFEMEVLGRNGAFLDDQHCAHGELHELRSGSHIQIGGISIRFVLPDVEEAERATEGTTPSEFASAGAMSFDFEDGRGESVMMADSSQSSQSGSDSEEDEGEDWRRGRPRHRRTNGRSGKHHDVRNGEDSELEDDSEEEEDGNNEEEIDDEEHEDDEDEEEDGDEDENEEGEDEDVEVQQPVTAKGGKKQYKSANARPRLARTIEDPTPPTKRKGPGRPPKNGVISKREQALQARKVKEAAKAEALKVASSKKVPSKTKLQKVPEQSASLEDPDEATAGKRKYTKRRQSDGQIEALPESTEKQEPSVSVPPEQQEAQLPKPVKDKKPPKPPRSPSPVWDESKLTPEELAKPSQSYVVLIHEALSNSPSGQMSLPQIYRAIERRYPFFKLRVTTQGWQSSVRHNLSQHAAFRKIEREGKGWMWGLVPTVSIEKEKRRRATPPPAPQNGYYPPPQFSAGAQYPNSQYPPHFGFPQHHAQSRPQANGYAQYPLSANIHGAPATSMPALPPHLVGFRGPLITLPIAPPSGNTYRSPYDSNPPPEPSPPAKTPQPPSSGSHPMNYPYAPPPSISQSQGQQDRPASNQHLMTSHLSPSHARAGSPATYPPNSSTPQQYQSAYSRPLSAPLPSAAAAPPPPPQQYQNQHQNQPQPQPHPQTQHPPETLAAIEKFKSTLIKTMTPGNPNADVVVNNAVNRVLSNPSAQDQPLRPQEQLIANTFTVLLVQLGKKNAGSQTPAPVTAPGTTATPPPLLPPASLTGAMGPPSAQNGIGTVTSNVNPMEDGLSSTEQTSALVNSLASPTAPIDSKEPALQDKTIAQGDDVQDKEEGIAKVEGTEEATLVKDSGAVTNNAADSPAHMPDAAVSRPTASPPTENAKLSPPPVPIQIEQKTAAYDAAPLTRGVKRSHEESDEEDAANERDEADVRAESIIRTQGDARKRVAV